MQRADLGSLHRLLKLPVRNQEIKLIATTVRSVPKIISYRPLNRALLFVTLQIITGQTLSADMPIKQYFSCVGSKSSIRKDWGEKKIVSSYKKNRVDCFF